MPLWIFFTPNCTRVEASFNVASPRNFFHPIVSTFNFIVTVQTACRPLTYANYTKFARSGISVHHTRLNLIILDIAKLHPIIINTELRFEPYLQRPGGSCDVSIWSKCAPCTDTAWVWRVLSTGWIHHVSSLQCSAIFVIFFFSFFAKTHNPIPFFRLTHDVIPVDIKKECALEQEKCTCVKGVSETNRTG